MKNLGEQQNISENLGLFRIVLFFYDILGLFGVVGTLDINDDRMKLFCDRY